MREARHVPAFGKNAIRLSCVWQECHTAFETRPTQDSPTSGILSGFPATAGTKTGSLHL
jgi:hypothetical protein